jgi:hypothetical protein
MYHRSGEQRSARASATELSGSDPLPPAQLAIIRVQTALNSFTPGMPFDASRYRAALLVSSESQEIPERLFCLGWLHWLDSDLAAAESVLLQAAETAQTINSGILVEASYWLARVAIIRKQGDAVARFEAVLRKAGGSPQATAWFVDLLWRAGRVERAEQILKTVRTNRRFAACDEVPLLEARSLLRRDDLSGAERFLLEAKPAGAVAGAERWLLLAWISASQSRHDEAAERFDQVRHYLCPASALKVWERLLAYRAGSASAESAVADCATPDAFFRGQAHRLGGRAGEATVAHRAALTGPSEAFARYALARMGDGDFAALIASQPGHFLALRCRAQIAIDRFRVREASPAECLDKLQLARSAGYQGILADHFCTLATALRQRGPEASALRELAAAPATDPAARRNFRRAAIELAGRRLAPAEALPLLEQWTSDTDDELRSILQRQLDHTRLQAVLDALAAGQPGAAEKTRETVATLLSSPDLPGLLAPAAVLWQAAQAVTAAAEFDNAWRDSLSGLAARWQPLALALLVHETAKRGDAIGVVALLQDSDAWRQFGTRPPRFVIAAVERAFSLRRDLAAWQRVLPGWLGLWTEKVSATLASGPSDLANAGPPTGVSPDAWYLPLASRAIARKDYREALACVQRVPLDGLETAARETVRSAIPELERYARAQALAAIWQPAGLAPVSPELLVDAVDLLLALPAGTQLLEYAVQGNAAGVTSALAELLDNGQLPPRLAHHFALLERRCAEFHDGEGRVSESVAAYRRSWAYWLRFLATGLGKELRPEPAAALIEELLGRHRRRINALLARAAVDLARLHWELIAELPNHAAGLSPSLAEALAKRIVRFRDELATDFILAMREAMRHAPAPEGFRANYEPALTGLRRLLSLDRDNLRLLTALIETCGDWFFDLYNRDDRRTLCEQVERFTPFALQLARLIEGQPGALAARVALAGFTKVRGFVATEGSRKAELYREALRFNPADENVRQLLADLEGSGFKSVS